VSVLTSVPGWRSLLPAAQWLSGYRTRWLAADVIAGITLAAYAIPISMAYAALAGLAPQHGIYCYLLGGLFYAAFGTARQLAIGPTSAIALLVGATVADMANGDASRWAAIASLAALVVAGLSVRVVQPRSQFPTSPKPGSAGARGGLKALLTNGAR
jgi:sulfate permease, SulP family